MNVVIIGAGNVATVLGRLMVSKGIRVIQVKSRNSEQARILAELLQCSHGSLSTLTDVRADLILLALSDRALTPEMDFIQSTNIPVVHTAGSVPMNLLKACSSRYGILYPLQTLRKETDRIPDIPFLIDASDEQTLQLIRELADKMSASVEVAGDETRQKLHLSAVIVNNFTNHLFKLASDYCSKENLPFDLLKPLILETTSRIMNMSPAAAQTGPAIRKDLGTLEKHLSLLGDYPELKNIYLALSNSIMENQ